MQDLSLHHTFAAEQSVQTHRLAIDMDNSPLWLAIDRQATELGWVIIPVPAFFSTQQRDHLIQVSAIDVVCCDPDRLSWWRSRGFQLVTDASEADEPFCCLRAAQKLAIELPEGTHKVTFTSGTTGQPKGVCLSEAHLLEVGRSLAAVTRHLRLSRHLSVLPYSVLLENVAARYANQYAGLDVISVPMSAVGMTGSGQFDPAVLLQTINQHQADSMILMPQMLKQLVMHLQQYPQDLSSLRFIAVGGAVCPAPLVNEARALGLPVFQGYGISECGSVICLDHRQKTAGSVGQPLPHCAVKLAADGEVLVRGPQFLGYLGQQPDSADEAWYATGDVGYFDDQHCLHISGRKKHLIINSFGRNILPDWIEGELLAIPGIMQAVVYGEARPHLTALCFSALSQAELTSLVDQLNQRLPDYAQLKNVLKVSAFTPQNGQLTPSGKPKRDVIFHSNQSKLESIYAISPYPATAHAL